MLPTQYSTGKRIAVLLPRITEQGCSMVKMKLTRDQVLDQSKGFCVACAAMFPMGKQTEHVTNPRHIASVGTFEDHQANYWKKHGAAA